MLCKIILRRCRSRSCSSVSWSTMNPAGDGVRLSESDRMAWRYILAERFAAQTLSSSQCGRNNNISVGNNSHKPLRRILPLPGAMLPKLSKCWACSLDLGHIRTATRRQPAPPALVVFQLRTQEKIFGTAVPVLNLAEPERSRIWFRDVVRLRGLSRSTAVRLAATETSNTAVVA